MDDENEKIQGRHENSENHLHRTNAQTESLDIHMNQFEHCSTLPQQAENLLDHEKVLQQRNGVLGGNRWTLFSLFIAFFLASFGFSSTASSSTIELDKDLVKPIELGPHYQLFVDAQHAVTIEDILSPSSEINFSPLVNGRFNLGYKAETHWFKVSVNNPYSYEQKRLLEFNFPLLDEIGVYIINTRSKRILARYDTGDTRPFENRVYQQPNFVFPITLPKYTHVDFYFRIKSKGSMTAGASLWQPEIFPEHNRLEYFYIALYIGLLVGLSAYNFLLFLSLREVSYLYYVLFSSSMLFAIGSFNGLWFELIWPTLPLWHNLSVPISFGLAGLFAAQFSKSFLQTASNAPLLNRIFSVLAFTFAASVIASPFISLLYIAPIISISAILLAFTSLASGITLSLRNDKLALIYLGAWLFFIIGTSLFVARNFGWVPNTLFTRYGIAFGSAIEMVLLSFALAQRIRHLHKENHNSRQAVFQANNNLIDVLKNSERELISRVKKRTQALERANRKLQTQEAELKKLVHYDSLTGLANRALVTEQLNLSLTRCKRDNVKLAVFFLDLDGFKAVNDQFGHQIGDELLISIARKLRKTLRDSDLIGRLGGDEFIVLAESSQASIEPKFLANKIKKAVAKNMTINGLSLQVGVSIGIAIYPDDGEELDTLISIADTKMYADKSLRKKAFPT